MSLRNGKISLKLFIDNDFMCRLIQFNSKMENIANFARVDDGFEIQLTCAAVTTVKHDCKICCKIYQQKWHNESMVELMAILTEVNRGNLPEQKQLHPCKIKIV